jgi:hypothetical protein
VLTGTRQSDTVTAAAKTGLRIAYDNAAAGVHDDDNIVVFADLVSPAPA